MASKEEQVGKNLNVEDARQENETERGKPTSAKEDGKRPQGGREAREPGGNVKQGRVWRLAPNFRWGLSNKHVVHNEGGDDAERIAGQMIQVRRKIREQQMRHYMRSQIPEPDNHDDFCLIP
ncbi:protein BEX4 [Tenrec ecaudatus]|uniref:protein BEX4 n=1 Tax=Tenrec ecaudatus TaxID=94439 RepID=UPI003F5A7FA5